MYCEKCGKMNAEGAIFCSNCSTILRSRRQSTPAPEGATKRFSVPEQTGKKEVPVAVKERPAPKAEEERPLKREKPERPLIKEEPKECRKPAFDERLYEGDPEKSGSVWFGVLAAMSWLVFVAFAAVGIAGGGWLLLMGLSEKQAILSFGGGVVLILCFVVGLTILSKNMIYIKMAKAINELNNRK